MRDVPEYEGLEPLRGAASVVCFAGFILDLDAHTLVRESRGSVPLTRGEFALLRVFVTRPGRVVSRNTLLDALANRRFEPFDRSVDVMIGRIRRKIEPDPKQPSLIVTVPGEGYRFDGLTKTSLSDQGPSTAVLGPQGRLERESGNRAPLQQRLEGQIAEAEHTPRAMPVGMAKASTRRLGSPWLPAATAALLLLAAASGRFLLASQGLKPAQATHLSIVVLPFANLSGDPSQGYFADGITENLTTELSRIHDSFVIARSTAVTYKGKSIDAKAIGNELGVRYMLEGSAQRDQNRVRVNAQLVDAETGAHRWADRFEADVADLFKLQDDVVARLAHSLNIALIKAEAERGARSKNPDVIDLTMRGMNVLLGTAGREAEDLRESDAEARALFDRALQIDPNDADALAGSAATYLRDYDPYSVDPQRDFETKVLGQANRAIALDPGNTDAYQVKADYLNASNRFSEALGAADAGLAVNPNSVWLYSPRATAENALGRFEQAKADAERAMRLSPRDPFLWVFHLIVGDAEFKLGHFDLAIEEYRKAVDLGDHDYANYMNLGSAYAQAGRADEAKAAFAEARRLSPKLSDERVKQSEQASPAESEGRRKSRNPEE
jgi:TolB-like protein/DNA-binding winged helix-turn-helix (wHTH) protein/Flp pilus assembly protein TadD